MSLCHSKKDIQTKKIIKGINKKINNTTFGEIRVAERTNLIDIKSIYGISILRDKVITTNGGAVSNVLGTDSEYSLTTTTNISSTSKLQTRARGRYVAGIEAEVGIAIRLCKTNITGNGYYLWGYYDENNGYGFRYDKLGLHVFVRKGGVDTIIHQNFFNVNNNLNKLDNEGVFMNTSKGNIFNISITWYGYGDIIFIVNIKNTKYILHKYSVTEGTSTNNPNLPLTAEINNNNSAESLELCVAGRQYSHLGSYNPSFRLTPIPVFSKSIPSSNTGSTDNYTPILTIRRKNNFIIAPITIESIEVLSNQDVIISIFSDTTLVGDEVYIDVPNISTSETSIEYNTTASDFTGSGILLMSNLILGGGQNKDILTAPTIRGIDLSGNENITIAARALSTNATISILFTLREEF